MVSYPHAAEVWALAPSPTQPNILASVSNSGALTLPILVHMFSLTLRISMVPGFAPQAS